MVKCAQVIRTNNDWANGEAAATIDPAWLCKRKVVACAVMAKPKITEMTIDNQGAPQVLADHYGPLEVLNRAHNGPCVPNQCTGRRGACGCSHAEPRAIIGAAGLLNRDFPMVLVVTYSPCSRCANIIVDSRIISHVVWCHTTAHDYQGIEILQKAGLKTYDLLKLKIMSPREIDYK